MMLVSFLEIAILASMATAAPTSNNFAIEEVSHNGVPVRIINTPHNVFGLTVPFNGVNVRNDVNDPELSVFFTAADIKDNGEKDYKGLYLLKGNKVTNILETGTDSAADRSDSRNVYISATDGLYVYNSDLGKAVRYGSVTDNLISVVKLNSSNTLYVLTADYVVYKVTDNGEKKVKVDELTGARQIVLDNSDNLYYLSADNQPYMLTKNGGRKISGLPDHPTSAALFKPPFMIDDVVVFASDSVIYWIHANGTSEFVTDFTFNLSAYSVEGFFIQYMGVDKIILEIKLSNMMSDFLLTIDKNILDVNKSRRLQFVTDLYKH